MWASRYLPELTMARDFVIANRVRFLLFLAGDIMQVVVIYFIWNAALAERGQLGGMDRNAMITYIFVAQACRIITAYNMENQFAFYIRTGDVIRDLIVPQTYVWKRLWFTMGWLGTIGGMTVIPLMAVGVGFFGVALPSVSVLPALAVSLFLSMLISYGLSSLTASVAFWTDGSVWGVSMAKTLLTSLAGGAFIPLSFFPAWLAAVAKALPFQAGVTIPTAIYQGQLHGGALWTALGVQLFWACVLVLAADRFFAYSVRKMTIPGG
ncbi:MAG TPA: ABC-2 family transporter protein [Symbiobacteriaceae bacterium]|nr:ABC-2 family transporter protein [Symbiobacteriaceae bacterium]